MNQMPSLWGLGTCGKLKVRGGLQDAGFQSYFQQSCSCIILRAFPWTAKDVNLVSRGIGLSIPGLGERELVLASFFFLLFFLF